MELVLGPTAELQPGPYVNCPEENCVYVLDDGILTRFHRGADEVISTEGERVDSADHPPQERPRLQRIARMLVESRATSRLASPFLVFVPREEADLGIRAGSGVVGAPLPGTDDVHIYFEGGIYRQSEMSCLADRVFYAHGRLIDRDLTVAQMKVPIACLIEVGTFDPSSGTIAPIDARSEGILAAWLGSEYLDPSELRRSPGTR